MEGIRHRLLKITYISKPFVYICFVLIISIFLSSCLAPSTYVQKEPAKGIYHRVKKGETFRGIARAYAVKMQDLAEVNNIRNPDLIEEGSVIFIPDANQVIDDVITSAKKIDTETKTATRADSVTKVKPSPESDSGKKVRSAAEDTGSADNKVLPLAMAPEKEKIAKLTPREDVPLTASTPARKPADEKLEHKSKSTVEEKEDIQFEKKQFIWPVRGSVKTRFGIQPNKTYHNWVKIVSVAGSSVKAAANGMVIFSAHLKDYGETIIIRHENSYATVYTHLKKRYVKTDQKIKKGDVIAVIGEIDEAGDSYMNFEVRLHGKARNPLFFLP
ncbi:MAG: hypothetical protein CVU52_02890 [Deltaproteobacteria bacterium HGW-Deltaproteobacteria-10]|nr:MAG: hypothetical protein CVU52_02890 [Deltaproteobacteria bacterium HGW-Deltaproteobacteria-10]